MLNQKQEAINELTEEIKITLDINSNTIPDSKLHSLNNEIQIIEEENEEEEEIQFKDGDSSPRPISLSKSLPYISLKKLPLNDSNNSNGNGNSVNIPSIPIEKTKTPPPSILLNSNEITLGSFDSSKVHHSQAAISQTGTLVGGMSPIKQGSIFDHFIVVGLPSTIELHSTQHDEKQVHKKPQIIYKYPPDQDLPNDMIEQFCFPNGIISRSSQRSLSSSSLNQIAFCNLSHLLLPQNSFIFLITDQLTLYYGICIIKDEEVSTLPNFIDPESELNKVKYENEEQRIQAQENQKEKRKLLNREQYDFIAPRVYCMISRFPIFQLHFQMLHAILESERMLMLFSMSQSIDPGLTTRAIDILNLYYGIKMDTIKDRIQFKIPSHDYKTDFHCPPNSEDRLVADWSIYNAFQILPIEDLLSVFSWIFLERQVLVVSKHLGNVSSLVFSFLSMLKPFSWQCCFIPVIPELLLESLEAPFPFIIGYNELPEYLLHLKRDYLIVDIDNKKLIYPNNNTGVPYLPGNRKLLTTLISHKKECQDLQNQIPIDHLKHRFTTNILSTFKDYQTWLIDQISYGIITCINNLYIFEQNNSNNNIEINDNNENTINNSNLENKENNLNSKNNNFDDITSPNITSPTITSPTQQSLLSFSTNNSNNLSSSSSNNNNNNSNSNIQIDALKSIELLNKQSIRFLENEKNIQDIVVCLPDKYQGYFNEFFHTQMFSVNAVKLMLSIQERHKTSISLIEKLESLIQMEEKSKEVLMEYQRIAKKENNKANVDMNILKKQLKDSEGVINELRESKKKLEMEALATSPSKGANLSLSSLLGLSTVVDRKKKLEFGHRRSRSVTDQVEKNILKKSLKPPSLSFFSSGGNNNDGSNTPNTPNSGRSALSSSSTNLLTMSSSGLSNSMSSKPNSPTSVSNSTSILDIMEKVDQQLQQSSMPNTPSSISPIKTPRNGANSPFNISTINEQH